LRHFSSFPTRRSSDLFFGVLLVDRIADHDGAGGHVVVASFDEKVIAMSVIGGGVLCADHAAAAGTIADRFLGGGCLGCGGSAAADRKSTRLNSSHVSI